MKAYLKIIIFAILLSALIPVWGIWHFGGYLPLVLADTATAASSNSVTVNAVGDVMLARKVERMTNSSGLTYPVQEMTDTLQDADITFGNLECSLSDLGTPMPGKGIWLRGKPENVKILQAAGFDIVGLANNHAMDYEEPALLQTLSVLEEAGISHFGAGKDISEAKKPEITDIKGVKIAWLAYSEMADLYFSFSYPRPMQADEDSPGISPYVFEDIIDDISVAKDQADIVIVTLHWGIEYTDLPQDYQIRAAHQMVEAGADIIIGHHPHCIQGVEIYKQGLIAYSLGNFIFDQDWSVKTSQGLMLQLTVNRIGWQSAQFLPVYIEDCQPRYAEGELGAEILNKLQRISEPFDGETKVIEGKLQVTAGARGEQ